MNKVEKLVQFFQEHPEYVPHCGIYDSRNTAGDEMENVYCEDGVSVDFCYFWDYIEIFGLTEEEFRETKSRISDMIEI